MQVALRGVAAGMAATAVFSALERILPGMSDRLKEAKPNSKPQLPQDPMNRQQVREWQERSWTPALQRLSHEPISESIRFPDVTAAALVQPMSPGPEGLAEQFAFKFASGLFDLDISSYVRPAGLAVHFAYGSAWGLIFGLLQASQRHSPLTFGALYGFIVYMVGPACVVPAMKLIRPLNEEPTRHTASLIAGHIIYVVALAKTFEQLDRGTE